MAYVLYHKLLFNNRITNAVEIRLYKKDGDPDREADELRATFARRQALSGEGDKFDTIIASELVFGIRLPHNSPYTYKDFLVSFHDEWQVELINENNIEFVGWLTPSEGESSYRDLPYEIQLTATDGLGFLKTDSISHWSGEQFGVPPREQPQKLMDYVAGALAKTRLTLPIRTYCSITEASMGDRNTNPDADIFQYAKLDYRTFQNDDGSMMTCYETLERLLKGAFSIYQWFGQWVVLYVGDMQSPPTGLWYSLYNYQAIQAFSNIEGWDAAQIARQQILHPRDADQNIASTFAIKYARHYFNYKPWPELPKNNKFERGTVFEEGDYVDEEDFDGDGNTVEVIGTYKRYTIDDWEQGIVDLFDLPHPAMTPAPTVFYRQSVYNEYGVEIDRRLIGESFNNSVGSGSGNAFWLRSQPIPVKKGGRVEYGIQKRFDNNFSGSGTVFTIVSVIYLVGTNGVTYFLDNNVGGSQNSVGRWRVAVNLAGQLILDYAPNQDTRSWNGLTVESLQLPVDGDLYIAIPANGPTSNTGSRQHFKDISITYKPYIAGGYVPVKGDYWKSQQNLDYKDVVDEEIFISDSTEKIFKGTLLQADGVTPTTRTWHRLNVSEARDYKELVNIAAFNHAYRRMFKLNGTFGGTTFTPINAGTEVEPLGFHRQFILPDDPDAAGKYFMLVPPLTIDYGLGFIKAKIVETFEVNSADGTKEGDLHEFKYIF